MHVPCLFAHVSACWCMYACVGMLFLGYRTEELVCIYRYVFRANTDMYFEQSWYVYIVHISSRAGMYIWCIFRGRAGMYLHVHISSRAGMYIWYIFRVMAGMYLQVHVSSGAGMQYMCAGHAYYKYIFRADI